MRKAVVNLIMASRDSATVDEVVSKIMECGYYSAAIDVWMYKDRNQMREVFVEMQALIPKKEREEE